MVSDLVHFQAWHQELLTSVHWPTQHNAMISFTSQDVLQSWKMDSFIWALWICISCIWWVVYLFSCFPTPNCPMLSPLQSSAGGFGSDIGGWGPAPPSSPLPSPSPPSPRPAQSWNSPHGLLPPIPPSPIYPIIPIHEGRGETLVL